MNNLSSPKHQESILLMVEGCKVEWQKDRITKKIEMYNDRKKKGRKLER